MHDEDKIYIAGHQGLVGSALVKQLHELGYSNLLLATRKELDLRNQYAVQEFFFKEHPKYVFLAAAKVGGIIANAASPGDFILENLLIETNVINAAYLSGVERLLFMGSSCIYPKMAS